MQLEFEDVWLEIRACAEGTAATAILDVDGVQATPALAEVLSAAEQTSAGMKRPGMWDYSRRLYAGEAETMKNAVNFTGKSEDSRSCSLFVSIKYRGSCYTLTLFAIKRSQ